MNLCTTRSSPICSNCHGSVAFAAPSVHDPLYLLDLSPTQRRCFPHRGMSDDCWCERCLLYVCPPKPLHPINNVTNSHRYHRARIASIPSLPSRKLNTTSYHKSHHTSIMQDMTDRRRSKRPAESDVQSRPDASDTDDVVPAQVRSSPAPRVPSSTTPPPHTTNWFSKALEKLKPRPKNDGPSTEKVARVETPNCELTDVEYFRACIHHFKWIMPPPKQLRKCFTRQFTRALIRNATAMNRSGQCFLAFVLHEAKKFLRENNISMDVYDRGRLDVNELGRCLSAIFHFDVADILVQTIGAQRLHLGRDLARTQCLHDRSFPDWVRLIAERVLLNPYMRAASREGLSVLLCVLDLHASLRLSDAARRSCASGPWSRKYMRISHRIAKRRRAIPRVTQAPPPNPLTAHPSSTSISQARHSPGLLETFDNVHEDESSAVYSAAVARQHLKSAQSPKQPTRRIQVFRNGAPHSLYATEKSLEEEIQVLQRRVEARRAHLNSPPGEVSGLAPQRSTFSASSGVSICFLSRMRTQWTRFVHKLCRNKRQPQVASRTRTQSQRRSDHRPRPQKPRVRRHRGSREKQEAALKQLEANILALQHRSTVLMEDIEWLQDNRPRPATAAVPSKSAAFRQWKREQARSADHLTRTSSQPVTSSGPQAASSVEQARSSNEQAESSFTQATSLDSQATNPNLTVPSPGQSATSSVSLFGPFTSLHGVASEVQLQIQSQQQDLSPALPNQGQSQVASSASMFGPFTTPSAGTAEEQSQPQGHVPRVREQSQARVTPSNPNANSNRFTSLRGGAPRNPSQERGHAYREHGQDDGPRSREQAQRQDQTAPRVPSDSPPTYAQSERDSRSQRDEPSVSRRKKFWERVKSVFKRVGSKKKSASGDE